MLKKGILRVGVAFPFFYLLYREKIEKKQIKLFETTLYNLSYVKLRKFINVVSIISLLLNKNKFFLKKAIFLKIRKKSY